MAAALPPLPAAYKPLQHYLKTAAEHDTRNIVVAYYCRLYALQKGMDIDRKTHESKAWLSAMIDFLGDVKKANAENEAIHNEVVGQAHMENYALQIFLYADNEDRAGHFGKNVVKSFYTAGMIFDVLSTFGEVSEDIENNKKYAKWKAAYIHRCLKNGETPIAGPLPEEGEGDELGAVGGAVGGATGGASISVPPGTMPAGYAPVIPPTQPAASGGGGGYQSHIPTPGAHAPPTTPSDAPIASAPQAPPTRYQPPANTGPNKLRQGSRSSRMAGVHLGAQEYQKAMKLCKFAGSALQYEDAQTAIDNLTKALNLLTTGKE